MCMLGVSHWPLAANLDNRVTFRSLWFAGEPALPTGAIGRMVEYVVLLGSACGVAPLVPQLHREDVDSAQSHNRAPCSRL
jgi:hypothetical protein